MKNKMIIAALLIGATIVSAQSTDNQIKVRVKKVENINGVEKISDTIYYVDKATALKKGNNEISIETTEDGKTIQKRVIIADPKLPTDESEVFTFTQKDGITLDEKAIDTAFEKAMKESGFENPKIVTFKECDQNGQIESGKNSMTVRIKQLETKDGVEWVKDTTIKKGEPIHLNDGQQLDFIGINNTLGDHVIDMSEMARGIDTILMDVEDHLIILQANPSEENGKMQKQIRVTRAISDENTGSDQQQTKKKMTLTKIIILDATTEDKKQLGKSSGITDGKLNAEDIKFYPNPSDGKFNLSFSLAEKGDTEIKILSIDGKSIYEENLKNFTGTFDREIDISSQPKGVYFVRIQQGEHAQIKKVVLE